MPDVPWNIILMRSARLSLGRLLASIASLRFISRGQFAITCCNMQMLSVPTSFLAVAAFEFVFWGHESDGVVQPNLVVMLDVTGHKPAGVLERQRRPRTGRLDVGRILSTL